MCNYPFENTGLSNYDEKARLSWCMGSYAKKKNKLQIAVSIFMKVHGIDECLYLIKLLDFTKISKFCAILVLFYCFFLWVTTKSYNIYHLLLPYGIEGYSFYKLHLHTTSRPWLKQGKSVVELSLYVSMNLPSSCFVYGIISHLNVCFLLNGCFDVECMIDVFLLCKYSFCSDKGSIPT